MFVWQGINPKARSDTKDCYDLPNFIDIICNETGFLTGAILLYCLSCCCFPPDQCQCIAFVLIDFTTYATGQPSDKVVSYKTVHV